jgi:serine/threonine protein kinase
MNRLGPVPPSEVAPLVLQIARALTSLHARNLVHHDVKPANVKQGESGLAVLLDLGSARFAAGGAGSPQVQSALRHLAMGAIAGTPGYMAPELREMVEVDDINSDRRLDIFALGCTIHQLVTNQALDQDRIDKRDQTVVEQAVSEITAHCPELATPAARALSYDVDARYATAQGMLQDLQQVVPPRLVVRESAIDFDLSSGRGMQEHVVVITNAGGGTLSGTLTADHPGIAFLRPDGQKAPQVSFEGNACALPVVVDAAALAQEREGHILVASSSGESTITCRFSRLTSRPISLSVNPTRAELSVTRQTTQQLTVKLVNGGGEPGHVLIRASRAGIVHITPPECQLAPGERTEVVVRPLREVRSGVHTLAISFQAEPGGAKAEVHLTVRVRASLWQGLGSRFFRRK